MNNIPARRDEHCSFVAEIVLCLDLDEPFVLEEWDVGVVSVMNRCLHLAMLKVSIHPIKPFFVTILVLLEILFTQVVFLAMGVDQFSTFGNDIVNIDRFEVWFTTLRVRCFCVDSKISV